MYRIGFIILALAAIALGLIVGTLNSEPVAVDLLWIQFQWPLGLVMLIALVCGFLVGIALVWISAVVPVRVRMRKLRSQAEHSGHPPEPGDA